jgi:aspartate aminotransferase-like enzyme
MPLKQYLMIPGPTPVPERILQAMNRPMINHRGPEFAKMFKEIEDGAKYIFQTKNDILIFPSSGSGGMEASVVNILSPGDKVLVLNVGAFGSRWVKILKAFGANVIEERIERGKAIDPSRVAELLSQDKNKEIKAVFLQHNETSTGVLNDVENIAKEINKHGAMIVVDAVSGLGAADLKTDAWGLDIVCAGSQKAFMVPPGVSLISISERAWKANENAKMPRFYWDFKLAKDFAVKGQTPVTPALSVLYGMHEAVKMIQEETLQGIFGRHKKLANATRAGVKALGLKLLAEEKNASKSVTAVVPSNGMDPEQVRKIMREKFGVVLAGGQEELKGKIFRIGHLGYIDILDILATFGALELVLSELGVKINIGEGAKAAQETLT